jgi:lysophospholipase L1-like esterase
MLNTVQFRVRSLSRLVAFSLLTVGLVVGEAAAPAPALAVPSAVGAPSATASPGVGSAHSSWSFNSAGDYVALGDSFTAGQGAPPLLPGPCLQSKYASYPIIAAAVSPYRLAGNRACSGASVADVPAQLAGVSPSTALVTITIGGIDAGYTTVLQGCAPDPAAALCQQVLGASEALLSVLGPRLAGLYAAIAATLPQARIVVLNYPLLFNPGALPLGNLVNSSTVVLNSVIQGAVAATANPRVTMVDVTQEFTGHGIGARVPYIAYNPADSAALPNFHPNALGNLLGYARALANDGVLRR